MKSTAALLFIFVVVALAGALNAQVAQVHTVYLLPMTNGLDQYLANRLTNLGVFQVVTDPKKADAVLTDGLGAAFENRLDELFPAPPAEASPDAAKKKAPAAAPVKGKAGEPAVKDESGGDTGDTGKAEPGSAVKGDTAVRFSSFRRSKGTVFLVDPRNRTVLWSVYDRPKDSSSGEMDRTAERIASRLKREVKSK
jgi:hypothetical protein